MGSGERKRCSNMAPVRRLRSLAWMKARKLPGVRCSTENTECRSLLCLIIMPGRSWVAGIDIAGKSPWMIAQCGSGGRRVVPQVPPPQGRKTLFYTQVWGKGTSQRWKRKTLTTKDTKSHEETQRKAKILAAA